MGASATALWHQSLPGRPTLWGVPCREMGPTVMDEAPRRRGDPGAASNVRFCRLNRRLTGGDPALAHSMGQG